MSIVLTPEGTPASPVEGEVYYDSTADKLKVRDASGFRDLANDNQFVGMIAPFAMATPPTGWLVCNGAEYAIATYGDLYTAIGTTWGSLTNGSGGAGSTYFVVPDLRGEFLRGFDNGTGNDPDATSRTGGDAVGSSQSDAIRNITGSYRDTSTAARGLYNKTFYGAFESAGTTPRIQDYVTGITGYDLGFDASNVVPTGSDNRPRNKYVQYCIKY